MLVLIHFLLIADLIAQSKIVEKFDPYSLQLICDDFLNSSVTDTGDRGICYLDEEGQEKCWNLFLSFYEDNTFEMLNQAFDLVDGKEINLVSKTKKGTFEKKGNQLTLKEPGNRITMHFNEVGDGLQYNLGETGGCAYAYHFVKVVTE